MSAHGAAFPLCARQRPRVRYACMQHLASLLPDASATSGRKPQTSGTSALLATVGMQQYMAVRSPGPALFANVNPNLFIYLANVNKASKAFEQLSS